MSPQTRRRWTGQRAAARRLLQAFDVIVAAEQQTAAVLSALCERRIETKANLKLAAPPLHADPEALMALRHACGARPLWLAASTHPGEDEILLAAHERLRLRHPEALLIIAPRHPERGPALAALAHAAPRRAVGDAPNASPVYIADTMGELGLFYAAATVCFLGGSLLPHLRGHNAVEPAKLGSAIIHGPFVGAHAEVFALLAARGGAIEAKDAASIAQAVDALWRDQAAHARQLAAARAAVAEGGAAFEQTIAALRDLVETPPDRASRHARP